MTSAANGDAAEKTKKEKKTGPRPKLVLVDGHALIYRAYHALPPDLRTSSGEPTNAVFGFAQMLLDTIRNQAPKYVVVTFDKGRTFRHEASPEYKANRSAMPDDLRQQIGRVRQLVDVLGIPKAELDNFEADDVIGTLSKQADALGLDTFILTADTDQHQLVSEHVRMIAPGGYAQRFSEAKIYDVQAVEDRYGFGPELVPDYKALVGDKSDNIPNVPGIGEKTASALLQKYGSLEAILDHVDELKPKQAETLRANADQARKSKMLTTIVRDADVTLDLEASTLRPFNRQVLLRLLQELEFRSLLAKVDQVEAAIAGTQAAPASPAAPQVSETSVAPSVSKAKSGGVHQMSMFGEERAPESADEVVAPVEEAKPVVPVSAEGKAQAGVPARVNVVRTADELNKLVAKLKANGRFVIDVESTSTEEMDAELVGISIAPSTQDGNPQEAYYITVGHKISEEVEGVTTQKLAPNQLPIEKIQKIFGPLLADGRVLKDAHNAKYDFKVLLRAGLPVEGLGYDTMLAAYLVGEQSIGLKDLGFNKLGVQMVPITDLIGKGRSQVTMDVVPIELSADYAAADVAVTERLRHYYEPWLQREGMEHLLLDLEIPLVPVLSRMELAGVAIDVPWLQNLSTTMHAKIQELEQSIWEEAKHPFNVGSTQQLGRVLFEEMQLPGRKKTQTGYSTDREVLDQLKGMHPIVDLIIEYRQLIKLKNTYLDALPLLVRRDTGRVHTTFNQAVAATGRLSSTNPNLQNIPIRTEIGRDVRKAFMADNTGPLRMFDEESFLLAADYSQIELRLLAHMAREQRLIDAFEQGLDIHAATAAEVMGVPIEEVDADSRRLAKTINFGVLYGMGSYGLARDSGLTPAEASKFIELYWSRYPAVRAFMDRTLQEGREVGYVSTLMGRRRYMPELMSRNGGIRQQGERMAINAPVQGTAADIIKVAMINLDREIRERGLKSKMLLQVHDELLFEVPASEIKAMAALVCETMEGAAQLTVPIKVEMKYGKNWGEMQSLKA
ncbi:MAG: DNA polymerase I [Chloroflexia bacterium]